MLLGRNHVTLRPKYILRILFLIQSAVWSSLFGLLEKFLLWRKIKSTPIPEDPVFIIGHWRTGTTYLHQLMNLDPANTAPTLFQVAVPQCYIIAYPLYKPILGAAIGKRRPMDKVRLGMNEPQEDEYAIFRLTGHSPLEKLVFPVSKSYFLTNEKNFFPLGPDTVKWKKQIFSFYRKLSYYTGKVIVSKNPFNSMRIPLLAEMFPKARFICIVRNPIDVVPSSIHMWTIVQHQNALSNLEHKPSVREIVTFYKDMIAKMDQDLASIPENRKTLIRYEDLERNPLDCLRQVYSSLSMTFTDQFEDAIIAFLKETGSFEKNIFNLTDEEKSFICYELKEHMKVYGYI